MNSGEWRASVRTRKTPVSPINKIYWYWNSLLNEDLPGHTEAFWRSQGFAKCSLITHPDFHQGLTNWGLKNWYFLGLKGLTDAYLRLSSLWTSLTSFGVEAIVFFRVFSDSKDLNKIVDLTGLNQTHWELLVLFGGFWRSIEAQKILIIIFEHTKSFVLLFSFFYWRNLLRKLEMNLWKRLGIEWGGNVTITSERN